MHYFVVQSSDEREINTAPIVPGIDVATLKFLNCLNFQHVQQSNFVGSYGPFPAEYEYTNHSLGSYALRANRIFASKRAMPLRYLLIGIGQL